MADVLPLTAVDTMRRGQCVRVSAYSKSLGALFPQHGPGPKHERAITLEPWQRTVTHRYPRPCLRGLIYSDGTRARNVIGGRGKTYEYARYQFSNMSQDIKDLFCEHCDLVGVEWP